MAAEILNSAALKFEKIITAIFTAPSALLRKFYVYPEPILLVTIFPNHITSNLLPIPAHPTRSQNPPLTNPINSSTVSVNNTQLTRGTLRILLQFNCNGIFGKVSKIAAFRAQNQIHIARFQENKFQNCSLPGKW